MPAETRAGFSLLEMVLVLVILGTALAVVAPSLGGWGRGVRLRSVGDEVVTATRWAGDRAATTGSSHRLVAAGNQIRITADNAALIAEQDLKPDRTFVLPAGVAISLLSPAGEPLDDLVFQPNGRVEPAIIRVTSEHGETLDVTSDTPARGFVAAEITAQQ